MMSDCFMDGHEMMDLGYEFYGFGEVGDYYS
jgi:hypothetical protein